MKTPNEMKQKYTLDEMKRAFETGRNFQLTGENNFQELIEELNQALEQPIRVRFYPKDTDETFDGTVVDNKTNYYVVIPDQNLMLTQNWDKKYCDVLR